MKNIVSIIGFILVAFCFVCCDKDTDTQPVQITLIENAWTASYEENTDEVISIFRPSDYKEFPPSMFRQRYIFHNDNSCEYLVLAPNDGHYMQSGYWSYDQNKQMVTIMNAESDVVSEFKIVELKHNLLKISYR